MSLDIYLEVEHPVSVDPERNIPVRENGQTVLYTLQEWKDTGHDYDPVTIEVSPTNCAWHGNITHNLWIMAKEAGIYAELWEPETLGITKAGQLTVPLIVGLLELVAYPLKYEEFNPPNGWGNYDVLVKFVNDYVDACYRYPDATIRISR